MAGPGIPSEGASARLGAALPFFNANQFNYNVGLKRACNDTTFQDLMTSFNFRYTRTTTVGELEHWFNDMEKAANGTDAFNQRPELTAPFDFWPAGGFRDNEMDKLFILATFRQAYEVSMELAKGPLG
ncbi:MAG: hypothetical protein Q9221_006624 [Calogaya cf. arnoldii]